MDTETINRLAMLEIALTTLTASHLATLNKESKETYAQALRNAVDSKGDIIDSPAASNELAPYVEKFLENVAWLQDENLFGPYD